MVRVTGAAAGNWKRRVVSGLNGFGPGRTASESAAASHWTPGPSATGLAKITTSSSPGSGTSPSGISSSSVSSCSPRAPRLPPGPRADAEIWAVVP